MLSFAKRTLLSSVLVRENMFYCTRRAKTIWNRTRKQKRLKKHRTRKRKSLNRRMRLKSRRKRTKTRLRQKQKNTNINDLIICLMYIFYFYSLINYYIENKTLFFVQINKYSKLTGLKL